MSAPDGSDNRLPEIAVPKQERLGKELRRHEAALSWGVAPLSCPHRDGGSGCSRDVEGGDGGEAQRYEESADKSDCLSIEMFKNLLDILQPMQAVHFLIDSGAASARSRLLEDEGCRGHGLHEARDNRH